MPDLPDLINQAVEVKRQQVEIGLIANKIGAVVSALVSEYGHSEPLGERLLRLSVATKTEAGDETNIGIGLITSDFKPMRESGPTFTIKIEALRKKLEIKPSGVNLSQMNVPQAFTPETLTSWLEMVEQLPSLIDSGHAQILRYA